MTGSEGLPGPVERMWLPGVDREVSVLGAGCWTIGGPATNRGAPIGWADVDPGTAFAALLRAYELGVNLFDTADVYGLGRSERLVGRLLEAVGRDQVVVSSKVGYFAGTAEHPYQPAQMLRQFATSLDNLGTGHLDIYFAHSTDFGPGDRYLAAAADVLESLRANGRTRAIGMRAPHHFAQQWADQPGHPHAAATRRWLMLYDRIRPDVLTVRHNMLSPSHRADETDIFAFARARGLGVLTKQVLAHGVLTGRYLAEPRPIFGPDDHRSTDPLFTPPALAAVAAGLRDLGSRFGVTVADRIRIAVQYARATAPDAAALIGFRTPDQFTATTVAAASAPLSAAHLDEIATVMARVRFPLTPALPTTS